MSKVSISSVKYLTTLGRSTLIYVTVSSPLPCFMLIKYLLSSFWWAEEPREEIALSKWDHMQCGPWGLMGQRKDRVEVRREVPFPQKSERNKSLWSIWKMATECEWLAGNADGMVNPGHKTQALQALTPMVMNLESSWEHSDPLVYGSNEEAAQKQWARRKAMTIV